MHPLLCQAAISLLCGRPGVIDKSSALENLDTAVQNMKDLGEDDPRAVIYDPHAVLFCHSCQAIPAVVKLIDGQDGEWKTHCLKCYLRFPNPTMDDVFLNCPMDAAKCREAIQQAHVTLPTTTMDTVPRQQSILPFIDCNIMSREDVLAMLAWLESPGRTTEECKEFLQEIMKKEPSNIQLKTLNPVALWGVLSGKVLKAETHKYLQFTLRETMQLPKQVKDLIMYLSDIFTKYPYLLGHDTDIWRATLVLIGLISTFTNFHIDWASAFNIAFYLLVDASGHAIDLPDEGDRSYLDLVLAEWYFVSPVLLKDDCMRGLVEEWMRAEMGVQLGVRDIKSGNIRCTKAKFLKLQEAVGDPDGLKRLAFVVEQRHGDVVFVQAGYMHHVVNVNSCVKFAFDVFDYSRAADYVDVWQRLHVLIGTNNAPDYVSGERIVLSAVTMTVCTFTIYQVLNLN